MRIEARGVYRVNHRDRTVVVEREVKLSNMPGRRCFYVAGLGGYYCVVEEKDMAVASMRQQRDFWHDCYIELLESL